MTACCRVPGCMKARGDGGLCHAHRKRVSDHGDLRATEPVRGWGRVACSVDDCPRKHLSRGYCRKHYQRFMANGDPSIVKPSVRVARDPYLRVMDRVEQINGCWVYQGHRPNGWYGLLRVSGGKQRVAHRIVYEALVGPIPAGLQLDHLCRNPPCVNPAHLEPVTPAVNQQRAAASRRLERAAAGTTRTV